MILLNKGNADILLLTTDSMSCALFEIFGITKPELKIKMTKDKMMNKYKHWDKQTATSPSGRHLGHFHSLFKTFKFKNSVEKANIEEKRDEIVQVHFIMLSIAAIYSHLYDLWLNILTSMIENDPGSAKSTDSEWFTFMNAVWTFYLVYFWEN